MTEPKPAALLSTEELDEGRRRKDAYDEWERANSFSSQYSQERHLFACWCLDNGDALLATAQAAVEQRAALADLLNLPAPSTFAECVADIERRLDDLNVFREWQAEDKHREARIAPTWKELAAALGTPVTENRAMLLEAAVQTAREAARLRAEAARLDQATAESVDRLRALCATGVGLQVDQVGGLEACVLNLVLEARLQRKQLSEIRTTMRVVDEVPHADAVAQAKQLRDAVDVLIETDEDYGPDGTTPADCVRRILGDRDFHQREHSRQRVDAERHVAYMAEQRAKIERLAAAVRKLRDAAHELRRADLFRPQCYAHENAVDPECEDCTESRDYWERLEAAKEKLNAVLEDTKEVG